MAEIRSSRVASLRINRISPNPHNPRRLFDKEPMEILIESIRKLGILVPITVYEEGSARYVLLDGERRWRCAKELKSSTIPAIIIGKPSDEQNILTMFHIHNARQGWQLMPTALKLKTLMDKLKEKNERKLAELTKLSLPQIRRCKILLTYPKSFQNLMLAPPSERLKADFFIELHRIRGPALENRFPTWASRGDSQCIQLLLDKYENGVIEAVTEFRRLAEINRARVRMHKKKRFMRELSDFLDDPESTISDIHVPGASFAKEAKEISRSANRLLAQISTCSVALTLTAFRARSTHINRRAMAFPSHRDMLQEPVGLRMIWLQRWERTGISAVHISPLSPYIFPLCAVSLTCVEIVKICPHSPGFK